MKTFILPVIALVTIGSFFIKTEASAQDIASGYWHTLSLCTDGTVSARGYNFNGELGDGTNFNSTSPVPVQGLSDITAVGCGRYYSMALKSDSTLWVWGHNQYGQFGNGTQTHSNVPLQVPGLSGVKAMDGSVHTIVLKGDSTVWTWGYNAWGQMGNGTVSNTPTLTPIQVAGLSGIVAVEAAFNFSVVLKSDSTVWAWGNDNYGQLGNGAGPGSYIPIQVIGLTGVIAITASDEASYALKDDGTVWAWGYNEVGAIGDGTYNDAFSPIQIQGLSDIVSMDDGSNFAIFLKSDGTVWTVGDNNFGQLGIGSSVANSNTVVQVTSLSDVVAIEAGTFQCFATKSDGTVWAWGWNNHGQLGLALPDEINAPIQVMSLCATTIGVEDEKTAESITIYPNPANDRITVNAPSNIVANIEQICITNSSGRIVWQSSQVNNQNNSIDVSQFADGVYMMTLQQGSNSSHQRFIVTH